MVNETWRDVVGYEGYYEVSDMGNVRSIDREVISKTGVKRFLKGCMMKQHKNSINGYMQVRLRKNGSGHTFQVHQLVAKAFLTNDEHLSDIDHINCDKTDNSAKNLRYVSHAENMKLARENGRFDFEAMAERMRSPEMQSLAAKSHMKSVIRNDGKRFESIKDAAKSVGCHRSTVELHLKGKRKSCNGYTFVLA